jgi:peptidyl-dipeptidase A
MSKLTQFPVNPTGIESVLAESTNYDELNYVWSEWRKVASRPMVHDYEQYVELNNKVAKANGKLTIKRNVRKRVEKSFPMRVHFKGKEDMSVLWKEPYETEDFQQQLENILDQTKPLFEKLHAYTRMKLRERYGEDKIPKDKSPIPASLLGEIFNNASQHARSS